MDSFHPEIQLENTESEIRKKLMDLDDIGFSNDETRCSTFYLSSKAETVVNERHIDDVFELINSTIISDIQKFLGKSSGLDF